MAAFVAGGADRERTRMSRPVTGEHVVCAGALPTISSSESIIDGNGMPPTIDAIHVDAPSTAFVQAQHDVTFPSRRNRINDT